MVAVTFLTRLPVPGQGHLEASDVGRATAFFPLVGAGIGAIQYGIGAAAVGISHWLERRSGHPHPVPMFVLAVTLVIVGVWITGALHLDGLADMADGFGGGRSREDVLRIMRHHAVGAYGSTALTLVLALKIASILSLIEHGMAAVFLIVAPAVARASAVVLGYVLPYARTVEGGLGGTSKYTSAGEVLFSSLTTIAFATGLGGWRGGVALAVTAVVSYWNGRLCRRRIQGITGDTLGANIEVCETFVLATGAFLASS